MENKPANKPQHRFRLNNVAYDHIVDYCKTHELARGNMSTALELMILEHAEMSKQSLNANFIAEIVSKKVNDSVEEIIKERVNNTLRKIQLGVNNADRNTQVSIEMLQGYIQMQNLEHLMSTQDNYPPFLSKAENLVDEKISNLKQIKDNEL